MDNTSHLIAIVGPTASGKTTRAVNLARTLDAEIVSADSRQVYRRMDLGTGKDIEEYGCIPYHLIDIAEPGSRYDLFQFQRDASLAIENIRSRNKRVIICGGSGLYIETLLSGIRMADVPANHDLRDKLKNKSLEELKDILSTYKSLHNNTDTDSVRRAIRAIEIADYYASNPEAAQATDATKAERPRQTIIGVDIPREERRRRIKERLKSRIEDGMIDEVKNLINEGISAENLIYYGLEYRFLTEHVIGRYSEDEMFEKLYTAICQFAKRQMTWLRGMERRGFKINWLPYDLSAEDFTATATEIINQQ